MDESDVEAFRNLILKRLEALAGEDALGQQGQAIVELDQQAVGRLSRMDALQSQAMAKAAQARRGAAERGLRAALARIDEGEFGYCSECGEDISRKRLEFDPSVSRCISCANG